MKIIDKITILTDPIPEGKYFFKEYSKIIIRSLLGFINYKSKYYSHKKYRGHFAVTKSLVVGLKLNNFDFNYNPRRLTKLSRTVVVLAGVRTLRQAIEFKQKGLIDKIFAGPNIVVFSADENSLLANPLIDFVITPSNWVIDLYISENPSLVDRIFSWPAGVDVDFWKPSNNIVRDQILIYEKRKQSYGPDISIESIHDYLILLGYNVKILRYGTFDQTIFLNELRKSQLFLGFSYGPESQSIAWAEAWSVDVPSLIWNHKGFELSGRKLIYSTAPYLSTETGLFFNDFEDFKLKFKQWELNKNIFNPRKWVLTNMSDSVCAESLINKITKRI